MPVTNVTAGQPITEAWGDLVADSVNALESQMALTASDAELASHAGAADPHTGYQRESERGAASGYASLDAGGKVPAAQLPAASFAGLVQTINFVIDGGGAAIAAGVKGDLVIDYPATITKWTLLADVSGSIVVDIWRDSYTNFPPVAGDKITASAPPTIAGATKGQSSTLTGWTVAIGAGDVLRFNVNSAATIGRCTIALTIART